jgi:hypothetical protein
MEYIGSHLCIIDNGFGWTQYDVKMLAKHIKDGLLFSILEEQH